VKVRYEATVVKVGGVLLVLLVGIGGNGHEWVCQNCD